MLNNPNDNKNSKKNSLNSKESDIFFFVVIILLHIISTVIVILTSHSKGNVNMFGGSIPVQSFTGVFSLLANTCLIFLVIFYKKPGFITAMVFLLLQFPMLVRNIIVMKSVSNIPGLFNDVFAILTIALIYQRNKEIDEYRIAELESLKSKQKVSRRLFEQTANALVNAIDSKDTYSHGHSLRVAEYSKKIAEAMGKSEEACMKVYYAALLHDVGKIGIPVSIINKKGKLTDEEYEVIKQHPVIGNQILSSISEYPYLSIGAHYHHERDDGKGYPDKSKGEDIPEIARIISVADAYDAMSSNRSYRAAIPQQLVREEFVKGTGTQFDPEISKIMQHLIDLDSEYQMKEKDTISELAGKNELVCEEYRSEVSDGIIVTSNITSIHMKVANIGKTSSKSKGPSLIMFDSLDGRVHSDDKMAGELNYCEYCEIWLDGKTDNKEIRDIKTEIVRKSSEKHKSKEEKRASVYDIEAVKYKDHVLIRIDDDEKSISITIALMDNSRFAYLAITGESCIISDVSINKKESTIDKNYIARIADEISYIDVPEGDLPNVQIDGYRTDISKGIPIKDKLKINFHTMSLPTARLVWHCAYFIIYHSEDGTINGNDYKEYALIRLDGENWETVRAAENILTVKKRDDFGGWDTWKEKNKRGYDCEVIFSRKSNIITTVTENCGIYINNMTKVLDGSDNIYVALTGDQCAITNIRINEK